MTTCPFADPCSRPHPRGLTSQLKWDKYGRKLYVIKRLYDFAVLLVIVTYSLYIKNAPANLQHSTWVLILICALMGILLLDEIRTTRLFIKNQRATDPDAVRSDLWYFWSLSTSFIYQHGVHIQMCACLTTLISVVIALGVPPPDTFEETVGWYDPDLANQTEDIYSSPHFAWYNGIGRRLDDGSSMDHHNSEGRRLKAGGGGSGASGGAFNEWHLFNEGEWAILWASQGVSILLMMIYIALVVFPPFERLNILCVPHTRIARGHPHIRARTHTHFTPPTHVRLTSSRPPPASLLSLRGIYEMLRNDLAIFMTVFMWLYIAFWLCLYILYPRAGLSELPHVPNFNSAYQSALALLDLSLLGERIPFAVMPETFDHLAPSQVVGLFLWLLLYYVWLILAMILMINMLIAMLTYTFDKVNQEAMLQSRLSYATSIMKLELVADSLGMDTRVGDPKLIPGKYAYQFRAYERRENDESDSEDGYEGDFDDGGSNPFLAPVSSQGTRMFQTLRDMKESMDDKFSQLEKRIDDLDPAMRDLDPASRMASRMAGKVGKVVPVGAPIDDSLDSQGKYDSAKAKLTAVRAFGRRSNKFTAAARS